MLHAFSYQGPRSLCWRGYKTVQAQGEECCDQLVMNAMDIERGNSQQALCLFLEPDCKIYNV